MANTKRGPCPVCDRGAKDTALAIKADERGTVEYCHRCGYAAADNFARRPVAVPQHSADPLDWSNRAERIWNETQPLGPIARAYLERRGCVLPPADGDLRFLPASEKFTPTLCARITDAVTAQPLSLHFTPLRSDGSARGERRLLAGHRKRGGVIRLWPDETVTHGLAIAEGIETCLAAGHLFTPAWATVDAGNLARFPVLNGIESLTIFADNDPAGLTAAQECRRRWRDAEREVRVLRARADGADVADLTAQIRGAA